MGSAVVQGATFVAVLAMTAFLWRVFGKRFDTFAAEVNGRFDRSAIEVHGRFDRFSADVNGRFDRFSTDVNDRLTT